MRSIATSPSPEPARPARPGGPGRRLLTGTEALVIVVIVVTAGVLARAGLPNIAILELLGAVTYVARRTVTGLREQQNTETSAVTG
ncbi:hypothetical protein ACFVUN_35925 [Kitasatospora griseola]|uniref:hypothetical protein n=1 Tax=Kitasatospora griseola TaxID=2064 RepID=UPI0036D84CCB